jgi:signal peptidase I
MQAVMPSFTSAALNGVFMTWILGIITLAGVAVLIWTAWDAARRGRNWFLWTLPVLLFGLFVMIPWLIRRRRSPIQGRLERGQLLALSISVVALVALQIMTGIFLTTFLFQVARVEGHAMEPTINDQDRLLVSKLTYQQRDPRRNDIVMLYYPLNPSKSFVKRVIAEEGDQVRIVDGKVFVNDILLDDLFVPPDFRSHDDWGPQVIPEGYYFVMGDHRNNSSDSRHWGFVPKKYITGKVQWRWWPIGSARTF